MKSSNLILVIGLFVASLSGCSESDPGISGPDNHSFIRQDMHVDLGDTFEISEKECGCTEYHLEILRIYNEDCIDLVDYTTEHLGSSDPDFVGGSTLHTWKYLAKKRGYVICQLGWVSRRSGTAAIKTYYIDIK
jgi:hypothetical protein